MIPDWVNQSPHDIPVVLKLAPLCHCTLLLFILGCLYPFLPCFLRPSLSFVQIMRTHFHIRTGGSLIRGPGGLSLEETFPVVRHHSAAAAVARGIPQRHINTYPYSCHVVSQGCPLFWSLIPHPTLHPLCLPCRTLAGEIIPGCVCLEIQLCVSHAFPNPSTASLALGDRSDPPHLRQARQIHSNCLGCRCQ